MRPLFGFSAAGVGVYEVPSGAAEEISSTLDQDPELQFAGRGLRDQQGAPVVYTENVFVKFAEDTERSHCESVLGDAGLTISRSLDYAENAFFVEGPARIGRDVFAVAESLLERDDVDLCHPEIVSEVDRRGVFPGQWHLQPWVIDGHEIDAHIDVVAAWELTRGDDVTIAIIDDGIDIDHEEFAGDGKIVAPRSLSHPRSDDPRPGEGNNHGTACSGVACAAGLARASGVAPAARLMPLRLLSGLGSQDEADAFVWAADHAADVISCSWGPPDGRWWDPTDPVHSQVVHLPDNTRLAIDYAIAHGREGRGCVITWAAGNGNESVDNDGYASYDKVIAVAACNDAGSKSAYSDFGNAIWCCFPSSHGEPSRTPGIWTTDRSGTEGYNPGNVTLGDLNGNYTNSFGGTSSACPGVAGVSALILARNPELHWDDVKEILRQSSDRIDDKPGEYDAHGRSQNYGFGRVNARAAVDLAAAMATGS